MDHNCRFMHETSLGHIMDIWDALVDIAKNDTDALKEKIKKNKHNTPLGGSTSLSKAASNLTLVFPVLCSRGISIENASMVSKAIEKNAVSMLQRLFASWQITDADNLQDYLLQFHGNISSKAASLDDVFRFSDGMNNFVNSKNSGLTFKQESAIKEDMRNINFYLPDSVNESSLSEFSIVNGSVIHEKGGDGFRDSKKSSSEDISKALKDRADMFNHQVLDSDFKKANELMPTTMAINFKVRTADGNDVIHYDTALAAVKAKLYPIASDDIVRHIADKTHDKNWITNFMRASTREISFMKDFVLAIDKAKIDALSLSDRKRTTDKMWKVLERRALTSRLKRAMHRADSASVAAITTLVVSQEEVEYLRKYNHVDLESLGTATSLFDSYNLMCLCIVDESLETVKFLYDEQEPMWETLSFTHLERQSSDNTYKKVINLMTKIR